MNPDMYEEKSTLSQLSNTCAQQLRGRLVAAASDPIILSSNEYSSLAMNTFLARMKLWVALSFLVPLFVIFPASATSPFTSTIWCSGPYKPLIVRFPRRGSGNLNNNRYISYEHFSSQIVLSVSSLLQIQIRYKLGKTRIQTQIYRNTNTNVWITHDRWNLAPAQ